MITTYYIEVPITNGEEGETTELPIIIDFDAVWQNAYVSGLPENCYPAESELTINGYEYDTPDNVNKKDVEIEIDRLSQLGLIEDACWDYYFYGKYDDFDRT